MPDVNKGPLDLEAELLTLWRRLLKSEAVTVDDDFFASGGDSLLAMDMLIEVERLISQPVPETILFSAGTIRQLAPKIAIQTGTSTTPFFQFHARGHRPPLYFFNGDPVIGHSRLRRMVELFGPDHPIISIDPHGLRGEPIPPTIEEMAADRVPVILEMQASGPFLLGGLCNGAMVAFEAARLLMAAGHKVDMVAMIDPPTVVARPAPRAILGLLKPMVSSHRLRWTYDAMARLEKFFNASASERITLAKRNIARLYDALSNNKIPPAIWDAYSIAMAQYLPAPLDVPVTFYAADYDGWAWRHLSSQLEVVQVPWGHRDCLTVSAEPLVNHLRQRIDALADHAPPSLNRTRCTPDEASAALRRDEDLPRVCGRNQIVVGEESIFQAGRVTV